MKPSELFCFEDTKNFAALLFCVIWCMDSLICITCSLENNAFSVLHYVMVALHYSVLHRFETFSAPGKITHGSIRLPPRNLASSRGCSLAIIFASIRASKSTYYLLYDKAHSKTHTTIIPFSILLQIL